MANSSELHGKGDKKSTKAAKSDMDDLLSRAATTDATNEKRSWRSKLYVTMLLGWSLRVERASESPLKDLIRPFEGPYQAL